MGEWHDLRVKVCAHSFERNPPSQHWLESDASLSYCWECAVKARGREFELGPLLYLKKWYERDEWQSAFLSGIDGGDWYSAQEDGSRCCAECGCTLHYWLTDYGIEEEIAYWSEVDFSKGGDVKETAYALDRLFECGEKDQPTVSAISIAFLASVAETATLSQHKRGGAAKAPDTGEGE